MIAADNIQKKIKKLPPSLQAEVFDFVEYLLHKEERRKAQQTETDGWSNVSLSFAMRGMEEEQSPTYSLDDLKVVFQ